MGEAQLYSDYITSTFVVKRVRKLGTQGPSPCSFADRESFLIAFIESERAALAPALEGAYH